MSTVQLPGSEQLDAKMAAHTSTQKTDVSLVLEFQKHMSNES